MDEPNRSAGDVDGSYVAVRFSTEDYPPHRRLDAWREVYGRMLQRLDIEPLSDDPFRTDATLRRLPGLGVNIVRRSAVVHNRRREFVSHDDVGLTIGLESPFEASQFGATHSLQAGGAILLTGAEPAALRAPANGTFIHLRVPLRVLAPLVPDIDAAYGRCIPADNAALQLLVRYIGILDETETLAEAELRRQTVAHVHDLIALAIGATGDGAQAACRGGRAARLRAIKQDIAARLGDATLSVGSIAARHRVTPRFVQRLFEAEGTTFTEHVLAARLNRAREWLADPRLAGRKISTIAFDAGFGDLSYFNRAFRRRYGATPKDVRACGWPPR